MPDQRESFDDPEEAHRSAWAGIQSRTFTALPCIATQGSDGHTCSLQPAVKRAETNGTYEVETYSNFPLLVDVPLHHPGGAGVTTTYGTQQGDEHLAIFSSRSIDAWHQSGGEQQPIFDRINHLSDAIAIPGLRSDPRKLHQVSQTSSQTRTDDKRSVIDHGPNGTHHKTVDPSTQAASADFDPFSQATKFFERIIHPTNGHASNATDGGTTHSTTLTHDAGFMAQANNGAHSLTAHPQNGTSILSTIAHVLTAPNASLDKSGNQSNQGSSTSKGDISSSNGNVSAPSGTVSGALGQFAGGFLGLLKFAAGGFSGPPGANGSLTVNAAMVAAPVLQANAIYTVAQLNAELPPSPSLIGTRAVVSDALPAAAAPTDPSQAGSSMTTAATTIVFLSTLQGGGTTTCPAFCDGVNWLAG